MAALFYYNRFYVLYLILVTVILHHKKGRHIPTKR
jgi:hypothetical protein